LNEALHHTDHVVVAVSDEEIDDQSAHGDVIVGEEHVAERFANFGIGGQRLEAFEGLEADAGI
jgi:hypothetical protein